MTKLIHQPHDKFFKSSLQNKQVAIDFFESYLPKELLAITNLSKLKLQNVTMIDDNYRTFEADIIYQVEFNKKPGFIYTLIEHLTAPSKMITWRMFRYLTLFIEHHLVQHENSLPLPLIYPLIVYTGEKPFTYSTDFFDLFDENKTLAKSFFSSPMQLVDVCRQNDDELRKHRWFGLAEFAFKYRNMREFANCLDKLIPWLQELEFPEGRNFKLTVLNYVLDGFKEGNFNAFIEKAKYYSRELEDDAMTIGEQLRQEGREQGMQQGMQQGMEHMRKQFALKLLAEGMSIEKIALLTELTVEEVKQLLSQKH